MDFSVCAQKVGFYKSGDIFHFNRVENREGNVKQVSVKVTNHETSLTF